MAISDCELRIEFEERSLSRRTTHKSAIRNSQSAIPWLVSVVKSPFFTVRVDRPAKCCLPAWSKENGHATDFRALARIRNAQGAQCTRPKTPEPEAHCSDTPL